jgi:hypothetical protein
MLRRLTAARAEKNTSRASHFVCFAPPHFLRPKKCYAFFFIGRKKTSLTAETLYAMPN